MKFEKLYWHDGNITNIKYIFPLAKKDKPKIIIEAKIYPSVDAPQRQEIEAEFTNVQSVIKNIDFNQLRDNVMFGSINYTKQKLVTKENKDFQEYIFMLFGGKIKIVSNKVKIKIL